MISFDADDSEFLLPIVPLTFSSPSAFINFSRLPPTVASNSALPSLAFSFTEVVCVSHDAD